MLKFLNRFFNVLYLDRRPDWEQKREREFILAANGLKTLSVTDRGGMSIDPEELRDQIIASREQLKHLVHRPEAPNRSFRTTEDAEVEPLVSSSVAAPVSTMDCIEVVAWRRLPSGSAVRYVCLQSTSTGSYSVATATVFSVVLKTLPTWVEGNSNREIANALQVGELHWYATVTEAMDAWSVERS